MEKILIVILSDRIEVYGSLFDFINYNTEKMEIDSTKIIFLNDNLYKSKSFIEVEAVLNKKKERLKLKYIDVIKDWESVGKHFDNIIIKEELI